MAQSNFRQINLPDRWEVARPELVRILGYSSANENATLYAVSNTTQSTSGTQALSKLSFAGAGNVSVGVTNGSVVISGAGGGGGGGTVSFSAGTSSAAIGSLVFSNSNGVSFGLNGSTITASHNGLTSQLNQVLSAANGSFAFQTATFANSNGVSFSTGTQGLFASVNTSYRASNDAIGLNTAQTNVTWTANSAGISLNAAGYAGTGTSATNASVTLNSNGLAISVAAGGGGGGGTASNWVPFPLMNNTSFSSFGQNTLYMQLLVPPLYATFSNIELYARGSFVSSSNSQAYSQTIRYGLYSQGTGASTSLMTQIGTSSVMFSASYNSNTAGGYTISGNGTSLTSTSAGTALFSNISGPFHLYLPYAGSMAIGTKYGVALHISSTNAVNTGPFRFAPLVMTMMNSLSFGKLTPGSQTVPNATVYGDNDMVAGTVTTGAMPASIAFSAMSVNVSRQKAFVQLEV